MNPTSLLGDKIENKAIIGLVVAIIVTASVSSAATYMLNREDTSETGESAKTVLTVKGDGKVKNLSLKEIKDLETEQGWGGIKDSVGNITT